MALFHPYAGAANRLPLHELYWYTDKPRSLARARDVMVALKHHYTQPHIRFGLKAVVPRTALAPAEWLDPLDLDTPRTRGGPIKRQPRVWIIIAFDGLSGAKAAIRREKIPKATFEAKGRLKLISGDLQGSTVKHPFARERQ